MKYLASAIMGMTFAVASIPAYSAQVTSYYHSKWGGFAEAGEFASFYMALYQKSFSECVASKESMSTPAGGCKYRIIYNVTESTDLYPSGDPRFLYLGVQVAGTNWVNGEPENYGPNHLTTETLTVQLNNLEFPSSSPIPEDGNLNSSDSCSATGNPIDIATGEKTDYALDYQTSDGTLAVDRRFLGQNQGWLVKPINRLTSTFIPAALPYKVCAMLSLLRKLPEPPFTPYYKSSAKCITYTPIGSQDQTEVILQTNGKQFLFEGLAPATTLYSNALPGYKLINTGSGWTLNKANGDVQTYNEEGAMLREDFARGGFIEYEYDYGGYPATQIDHHGRQLNFQYSGGNLVEVKLPNGETLKYDYVEDDTLQGYRQLAKVTFPDDTTTTYVYGDEATTGNLLAALTGKFDAFGIQTGTYEYEIDTGKAYYTAGANGVNARTLGFDANNTTTVTNSKGATTSYTFEEDDKNLLRPVSEQMPAGSGYPASEVVTTYNDDGNVTSRIDTRGTETHYYYSGDSRELEIVRVEGLPGPDANDYSDETAILPEGARKISTDWHPDWKLPAAVAMPRQYIAYEYHSPTFSCVEGSSNAKPVLCQRTITETPDANGQEGFSATPDTTTTQTWTYQYNSQGKLLTAHRDGVLQQQNTYYAEDGSDWRAGYLHTRTNAVGHQIQYLAYSASGYPTSVVDENGNTISLIFDENDRLESWTRAGEQTSFDYDLNGNLIEVTNPNQSTLTFEYDDAHRMDAVVLSDGTRIDYTLDTEGNKLSDSVSDASGVERYVQTYEYDSLSRLMAVIKGLNHETRTYDAEGNLTGIIDTLNNTTSFSYDRLGNQTVQTDALLQDTLLTYDAQNNTQSVTDANDNTTHYTHSGFGELTQIDSPDTGITDYEYDERSRRITKIEADGTITRYTYDGLDRLETLKVDGHPDLDIAYTYDDTTNDNQGVGRVTGYTDEAGATSLFYDAHGNLTNRDYQVDGSDYTQAWQFNAGSELAQETRPNGEILHYTNDTLGRISSIDWQADAFAAQEALITEVIYTPLGQIESITFANGITTQYTYDLAGKLTSIDAQGANPVHQQTYSYSVVDNITDIDDLLTDALSQDFAYDVLNRLTSDTGHYGNKAYDYDPVHNRTQEVVTKNGTETTTTLTYASDSNQLQTKGSVTYTTDARGSITQIDSGGTIKQLAYNGMNRLASVSVSGQLQASYKYNALGQRVLVDAGETKQVLHYTPQGQYAMVENFGASQQQSAQGTFMLTVPVPIFVQRQGTSPAKSIDEYKQTLQYVYIDRVPVALIVSEYDLVAETVEREAFYIQTDHLGTPRLLTNAAQQVVWRWDSDAFGQDLVDRDPDGDGVEVWQPLRFAGQIVEQESGFYYNYFRDYDPVLGRYVQSDPIGLIGGQNTYLYVYANPLIYTDPTGLIPHDWHRRNYQGDKCWVPTDQERRQSLSDAATAFGDLGTYMGWAGLAVSSKHPILGGQIALAGQVVGTMGGALGKLNPYLHPNDSDNDNDGIPDQLDEDDDNDGIPDQNDGDPRIWDNNGDCSCE